MKSLALEKGGTALLVELSGDQVTLLSPFAAPPGSSVQATFEGARVVVKVRGSRRVEPDEAGRTFRVEGRFVGLTREVRAALERP
jgi:hypothetical protein